MASFMQTFANDGMSEERFKVYNCGFYIFSNGQSLSHGRKNPTLLFLYPSAQVVLILPNVCPEMNYSAFPSDCDFPPFVVRDFEFDKV